MWVRFTATISSFWTRNLNLCLYQGLNSELNTSYFILTYVIKLLTYSLCLRRTANVPYPAACCHVWALTCTSGYPISHRHRSSSPICKQQHLHCWHRSSPPRTKWLSLQKAPLLQQHGCIYTALRARWLLGERGADFTTNKNLTFWEGKNKTEELCPGQQGRGWRQRSQWGCLCVKGPKQTCCIPLTHCQRAGGKNKA